MTARQILTAEQMRAAEGALIAGGISVDALMQRAGRGAAELVWRIAGSDRRVTVLTGPGNNGGDGWVIAQALHERGGQVRVVPAADPRTAAACQARALYQGEVAGADASGDVLVDCLFGSGLGDGFPNLVPYAKNDFILSAFGEELGFVGLAAILMLFAILVQRAMRIAMHTPDSFGQLLAGAIGIVIGLQTFIVAGGVTRLIPLTGLTTPLLSSGGSALVMTLLAIGVVLSFTKEEKPIKKPLGRKR